MRHDLSGPQIGSARPSEYIKELKREFKERAVAANNSGEIRVCVDQMDLLCEHAARDLVRIREIRAAHAAGKLPTEAMRQLPAYAAFKAYLDEDPSLVISETIAAALDLQKVNEEDVDSMPLSEPGQPKHPVSRETRAWMELRAQGLALADDTSGPACGSIPREDYITDSAMRVRKQAQRAISIGDLNVPALDVDDICWTVACEAYLLRSLKAAKRAGELTDEDIRKMPIYGSYKLYFESGEALVASAMSIAAIVDQIRPPGGQN